MFDRVHHWGRGVILLGLLWRVAASELLAFELARRLIPHLAHSYRLYAGVATGAIAMALALTWFMAAGFGPYRLRFEAVYPEYPARRP